MTRLRLGKDVLPVVVDSMDADAQRIGDLIAVQSLGNKAENLPLPASDQFLFPSEEANLLGSCVDQDSPRRQFLWMLLQNIADDQHQPGTVFPVTGKYGHLMEELDVGSILCPHPIVINQFVILLVILSFEVMIHLEFRVVEKG